MEGEEFPLGEVGIATERSALAASSTDSSISKYRFMLLVFNTKRKIKVNEKIHYRPFKKKKRK